MEIGICKLCMEAKKLNFEHVPPRSAANKSTRYKKGSFLDFMIADSPFKYKIKGKIHQGGVGFYSFCEQCNNFLGNEYVRFYKNWFDVGMTLVHDKEAIGFVFEAKKQFPTRTLKQILCMFLAINPSPLYEYHNELLDFIRQPSSTKLPSGIRVFSYLNQGPNWRYLGLAANGNLSTGSVIICSEITYPPFGYVLVINNDKFRNDKLTEITVFGNFDCDQELTLELKMNKLETNLPSSPMDYRSREEIEKQIAKG